VRGGRGERISLRIRGASRVTERERVGVACCVEERVVTRAAEVVQRLRRRAAVEQDHDGLEVWSCRDPEQGELRGDPQVEHRGRVHVVVGQHRDVVDDEAAPDRRRACWDAVRVLDLREPPARHDRLRPVAKLRLVWVAGGYEGDDPERLRYPAVVLEVRRLAVRGRREGAHRGARPRRRRPAADSYDDRRNDCDRSPTHDVPFACFLSLD
jgi:hypothetical protein